MRPNPKATLWLSALVLTAGLLPLRSDGDTSQCRNVTTSMSAQVNEPVAGDEAFFRLPSGPSNVMLLLDNSGSMRDLAQCNSFNGTSGSDFSATGTSDPCNAPALAAPAQSGFPATGNAVGSVLVRGTCYPATDAGITSAERNPKASWMEAVTPVTALPDPGHAATSFMTDSPPWAACPGTGANANKCLFDPSAYYTYGSWTRNEATRSASDVDSALLTGCRYKTSGSGPSSTWDRPATPAWRAEASTSSTPGT